MHNKLYIPENEEDLPDLEDLPDHKTIRLSKETLQILLYNKSTKQSWDGVVSDLIEDNEELHQENKELKKRIEELED